VKTKFKIGDKVRCWIDTAAGQERENEQIGIIHDIVPNHVFCIKILRDNFFDVTTSHTEYEVELLKDPVDILKEML